MRGIRICAQGPLGWADSDRTFSEDVLLLTGSGEVKPVGGLRKGERLVRYTENGGAVIFTILAVERVWMAEAAG